MVFNIKQIENNEAPTREMLGQYVVETILAEDETSRDSGVADMDFADAPTDFAQVDNIGLQPLDTEMEELALLDTEVFDSNITIVETRQRSFTDVSEQTSDGLESPKSRSTLFKAPLPHSKSFAVPHRKRSLVDSRLNFKKMKQQQSIDEDCEDKENKASCSVALAAVPFYKKPMLHRAFSTSDVEARPDSPVRNYHLPVLSTADSVAFGRIEAETLVSLMKSEGHGAFMEKYILVDCRYPYEYQGGHVKGAINLFDPELCSSLFYSTEGRTEMRTPIFYCEYSQKRGPFMAYSLRQLDRQRNIETYPQLDFTEIYVVDGGYKGFYEKFVGSQHQDMCTPVCTYTAMLDKRYSVELKKYPFHRSSGGGATTMAKKPTSRRHLAIRHQNTLNSCDSPSRSPTSRNLFSAPKADSLTPTKSLSLRRIPSKLNFS